jgi:hypothetical protein
MVLRYLVSLISGDDTDHKTGGNDELDFDFTNEEVQQLLQTDDDLLESLQGMVDDDLAHLVYEGESESHYAVLESGGVRWLEVRVRNPIGRRWRGVSRDGSLYISV